MLQEISRGHMHEKRRAKRCRAVERLTLVVLCAWAGGCGGQSPDAPSAPLESSVTFGAVAPASGSEVILPESYIFYVPGGVVIPPGSGLLSVDLSLSSAHDVPWAQLNVYLLTDETELGYCGQNINDAPTWQFLTSGWRTHVDITGFRVYRLPCHVTGIRAMLHMRNNGLLIPPGPVETIAEATVPVSFQIRR
jgi:hypothetical protein